MAACGLMEELLGMEEPKEFMFVSNVDNLGATVDLNILFHIMNANVDFAMEVRLLRRSGAPRAVLNSPRCLRTPALRLFRSRRRRGPTCRVARRSRTAARLG